MNDPSLSRALQTAVGASRAAGRLLRQHLNSVKKVNVSTAHDVKLELDVRSQKLIERHLRRYFPQIPVLGEEGISGNLKMAFRWVVDPIDGTVNFAHGIPHVCISIALQQAIGLGPVEFEKSGAFRTVLG